MRRFVVVGCNHSNATPEELARARVPTELLPQIRESLDATELVYLETCHRTEWYLVYDGALCPGRLTMTLARELARLTRGASALPPAERCLALQGPDASRHLFRVASALDSLMLGETQILGQVKGAYRNAEEAGLVGPLSRTLFAQAFRAAKRVRQQTALSRRSVSLVSLAKHHLQDLLATDPRPVAVVGAGDMATKGAELARELDPDRAITVFNRSRENGSRLAAKVSGHFRPLDELARCGREFSVVVAATSSRTPIIAGSLAARLAPCTLLDLGLPANVAAPCRELDGITLIDQVALRDEAEMNRQARSEEIASAEAIVEEQIRELAYELMEHELSPVARTLVAAFSDAARRELETASADGAPLGAEAMEAAIERLSQRLVRVPMRGLREIACQHSPAVLATFLEAVKQ